MFYLVFLLILDLKCYLFVIRHDDLIFLILLNNCFSKGNFFNVILKCGILALDQEVWTFNTLMRLFDYTGKFIFIYNGFGIIVIVDCCSRLAYFRLVISFDLPPYSDYEA